MYDKGVTYFRIELERKFLQSLFSEKYFIEKFDIVLQMTLLRALCLIRKPTLNDNYQEMILLQNVHIYRYGIIHRLNIIKKLYTNHIYCFVCFYLIQHCPRIFVLDYFMETIKQSREFGFCGRGWARLPQYYTHPQLGIITVVEHILAGFVFQQHLAHVRYTIIYFSCYPQNIVPRKYICKNQIQKQKVRGRFKTTIMIISAD